MISGSKPHSFIQIKNAKIPMLFIHGTKDNFVRTDMVYELYDAYPGEKEMYIAEGAGHGMSFFMDPDRYSKEVVAFLEKSGL